MTGIPAERCRDIWAKWTDYENQYGDLGNASRVMKRMKEAFPDDISTGRLTENLANQWKVFNLNSVGDIDLGLGHGKSFELNLTSSVHSFPKTGATFANNKAG